MRKVRGEEFQNFRVSRWNENIIWYAFSASLNQRAWHFFSTSTFEMKTPRTSVEQGDKIKKDFIVKWCICYRNEKEKWNEDENTFFIIFSSKEMPFIYHLEEHQTKNIQGNKEITKRLSEVQGKGDWVGRERERVEEIATIEEDEIVLNRTLIASNFIQISSPLNLRFLLNDSHLFVYETLPSFHFFLFFFFSFPVVDNSIFHLWN